MRPPTDKQLAFLRRLKYDGTPPESVSEASFLIEGRLSKRTVADLEGELLRSREASEESEHRRRRVLREQLVQKRIAYARPLGCVAFRVRVQRTCPDSRVYHGRIVGFKDLTRYPELSPPYTSCADGCDCDLEEVHERDMIDPAMMLSRPLRSEPIDREGGDGRDARKPVPRIAKLILMLGVIALAGTVVLFVVAALSSSATTR